MYGSLEEEQIWKMNREEAYYGSKLHFLRSHYDSALQENGFLVDRDRLLESFNYSSLSGRKAFVETTGFLLKTYHPTYYFHERRMT
jgi:hypothetical protein